VDRCCSLRSASLAGRLRSGPFRRVRAALIPLCWYDPARSVFRVVRRAPYGPALGYPERSRRRTTGTRDVAGGLPSDPEEHFLSRICYA
jgi:hypothetical protein